MNQHQRKFLLEAIEKQYKIEKSALDDRRPKAPSLNNYLIAAILDGSFAMRTSTSVRAAITERVRTLGKGEALLEPRSRYSSRNDDDDGDSVILPASIIFEFPIKYVGELEVYETALKEWKAEREALEASIGAMRIKVQIGSDKALDRLVEQADQLCLMSLTASNKLLLGDGKSS